MGGARRKGDIIMQDFSQGDIIKINGFRSSFLIVSKNAFIRRRVLFIFMLQELMKLRELLYVNRSN